jgi:hypothetical protein
MQTLFENVGGNQFRLRTSEGMWDTAKKIFHKEPSSSPQQTQTDPEQEKKEEIRKKLAGEEWIECPKCLGRNSASCELCSDKPYYFNQWGPRFGKKEGTVPASIARKYDEPHRIEREKQYSKYGADNIPCPNCHGTGKGEVHHGVEQDCTKCGGTGRVRR